MNNTYSFLCPATVMVALDAADPRTAHAAMADLHGEEFDLNVAAVGGEQLPYRIERGHRFTALTVDGSELDQINGVPLDQLYDQDQPTAPAAPTGTTAEPSLLALDGEDAVLLADLLTSAVNEGQLRDGRHERAKRLHRVLETALDRGAFSS